MARAIDVEHLGRPRVICAYETAGAIVDPGPTSSLDTLLDQLEDEPRAILLTHIHLDHAGATGVLCRKFPQLKVYVHERGARHMADPSKLLASAQRLYGDQMDRLWGEFAPVPQERIVALTGGERIDGGFAVEYTPGHASHHVSYFDEATGDAFVGDTCGVRLPPHEYVVAPTPPPDIDVELWLRSLDLIAARAPKRLCLTHFGAYDDVAGHLERIRESLTLRAEKARALDGDAFAEWSRAELRSAVDADTAAALDQAAPQDDLYAGLRRYWDKRAEREQAGAR
ncbi:MAG: MBL fold metallo-hydrolase [Solirubrobacterales bacterium]|nr:MBL fold metallo-hydrolase [Solirubrobacterales bacterium]